jgi:purine-binding chemotaxis protein CheW
VSVIRGETVPVVDAATLLGASSAGARRLVVLAVAGRRVALAVDAVLGIEQIAPAALGELPPLLASASHDAVRAVGTLDAELLVVLESARIVPDTTWAVVDERVAA